MGWNFPVTGSQVYSSSFSLPRSLSPTERRMSKDREPGKLQDGSLLREEEVRLQEEMIQTHCTPPVNTVS